jgi:serine/threonine-protein kinase HipA
MSFETYIFAFIPPLRKSVLAGRLRLAPGLAEFRYAPEYLANEHSFALDPLALPLSDMVFKSGLNGGMFGVVSDALPDNWGKNVLAQKLGIPPATLDYATLIKESSNERTGALTFGPDRNEIPATPSCVVTIICIYPSYTMPPRQLLMANP